MKKYNFNTLWKVEAPIKDVWSTINNTESWPKWWPSVLEVKNLDPKLIPGARHSLQLVWQGALPYKLTFNMTTSKVDPYYIIKGIAEGELEGVGTWTFKQKHGYVAVHYSWQVITHKKWMNVLAPLAQPIFKWNHDYVMKQGALGLSKKLNASVRHLNLS